MPTPSVLTSPQSTARLKAGFNLIAELLACTLGPTRGVVLSAAEGHKPPELLSDSATAARRMLALPDRGQDVGAMLLRNLVWRVHQRVGDGGAVTAVLAQALLTEATRYVVAGANTVDVQRGLRGGVEAALEALQRQVRPVHGHAGLMAVAQAVTGEEDLSFVLAELFDLLGPQAYITIEDYVAPYLERTYLDGGVWNARLASPYLITAPAGKRAVQADCRVVLYAGDVETTEDVIPLLETVGAVKGSSPALLLVAQNLRGEALNLLVGAHTNGQLRLAAAGIAYGGERLRNDLEDLAVLSGARVISPQTGRRLRHVRSEDLGRARRVEVGADGLLVAGGGGDPGQVRARIGILEGQLASLPFDDERRPQLEQRIGRLAGCAAVLKIGARTKPERQVLHAKAEQGLKALRATLEEGVLPGGGVAFLRAIPAVKSAAEAARNDEKFGFRAVTQALEAPFRRILHNAQIPNPGVILEEILAAEHEVVYDVVRKQFALAEEAGMLDPARVMRVALETAASGAAMALSTDTIVLKRRPRTSYEP